MLQSRPKGIAKVTGNPCGVSDVRIWKSKVGPESRLYSLKQNVSLLYKKKIRTYSKQSLVHTWGSYHGNVNACTLKGGTETKYKG